AADGLPPVHVRADNVLLSRRLITAFTCVAPPIKIASIIFSSELNPRRRVCGTSSLERSSLVMSKVMRRGALVAVCFSAAFYSGERKVRAQIWNCPCSIWTPIVVPAIAANNDNQPIEVGVKFRSDLAGFITAIRFYKGTLNTGAHVGHLWSA